MGRVRYVLFELRDDHGEYGWQERVIVTYGGREEPPRIITRLGPLDDGRPVLTDSGTRWSTHPLAEPRVQVPSSEEDGPSRGPLPRFEHTSVLEEWKRSTWPLISRRDLPVETRTAAALFLIRAWYDRSLAAYLLRSDGQEGHPSYWSFAAMVVYHRSHASTLFQEEAVVDRLEHLVGWMPGLDYGSTYWDSSNPAAVPSTVRPGPAPFGPNDLLAFLAERDACALWETLAAS